MADERTNAEHIAEILELISGWADQIVKHRKRLEKLEKRLNELEKEAKNERVL